MHFNNKIGNLEIGFNSLTIIKNKIDLKKNSIIIESIKAEIITNQKM